MRSVSLTVLTFAFLHGCTTGGPDEPAAVAPDVADSGAHVADGDSGASPDAGDIVAGCPVGPVAIAPAAPKTDDPLDASLAGDATFVLFTWFRLDAGGARVAVGTGQSLPASATSRGDVIEVTAASTLDPDCPVLSAQAKIANTAPAVALVSVSPSAAYAPQTLTCSVPSGAWDDPDDGDPHVPVFAWLVNDVVVSGATSATLAGAFHKHDAVRCRVTPSDGTDAGVPAVSEPVAVLDAPPEVTTVTLACPAPGEPFHCAAAGSDPDGDAVSFEVAWLSGPGECGTATPIGAGPNLTEPPTKGVTVFCCATPRDDEGLPGPPAASAPCATPNNPPVVSGAVVANAQIGAPIVRTSTLTCDAAVADADGDGLSKSCAWLVNGEAVESDGCTLAGAFEKGESVCCTVTASDGESQATSQAKGCETVLDTPPVIDSVAVEPASGSHCEPVTCAAKASDVDEDAVKVLTSWTVNGAPAPGPPPSVPDTLATCTATPVAGGAAGAAASASVLIGNSVPSLAGVDILAAPSPAGAGSLLTCVPGGWSDVDACDVPVYATTWFVNGVEVAYTPSLASGSFQAGDQVLCIVAPGDGYAFGTSVQSGVTTIANTPPTATSVWIAPPVGNHTTTFKCNTKVTEPDGDAVVWAYTWSVDGAAVPGLATETVTGVPFAQNGALLTCAAKPYDGSGAGALAPASNVAVLVNSPPKVTSVQIAPKTPDTLAELVCTATASDPEGDAVALGFEWLRILSSGPQAIAGQTGATLPASATEHYESIYCRVTPSDGLSEGAAQLSPAVVIANTPPSLDSATISPAGGTPVTAFACTAGGAVDVDGDFVATEKTWRVNGAPAATGETFVPASAGAAVGDTVDCAIVPSDTTSKGAAVTSNPVVLTACGPVAEGGTCDDGNACTTADACTGGACVGKPLVCDDGNTCTADGCLPQSGCVATPAAKPCNDGDPCTEGDACQAGACQGTPLACDDGNPCTTDACQGSCVHWPAVSACDDGDPCTLAGQCGSGACQPGPPIDCSDGDACTTDGCAPGDGCTHAPILAPCDDGNPCTSDTCAPDKGCVFQPLTATVGCNDGDKCTASDVCKGGVCTGGAQIACDDANPCTADTCVTGSGCAHAAKDGPCPGGTCQSGACCVAGCAGKQCGDDGCGGTCGVCTALEECVAGLCSSGATDGMVLVPSGGFQMGCNAPKDAKCSADENPYHPVTLPAFEIDATEVTVAHYKECVDAGECVAPAPYPLGCTWALAQNDDLAVNCIDWFAAKAWCAWDGKRLCTEAEWEKAARGTDGRLYPWGDETATCALAVMKEGTKSGCGIGTPWPVGLLTDGASVYGGLDMAGNISEWVADWYYSNYYENSPLASPKGPGFGQYRVHRGGGYPSASQDVRASRRLYLQPDNLTPGIGIRCCKSFP